LSLVPRQAAEYLLLNAVSEHLWQGGEGKGRKAKIDESGAGG